MLVSLPLSEQQGSDARGQGQLFNRFEIFLEKNEGGEVEKPG